MDTGEEWSREMWQWSGVEDIHKSGVEGAYICSSMYVCPCVCGGVDGITVE